MQSILPEWDLSDLFDSIDDPKIDQLLSTCRAQAKKFHEQYSGKLAQYDASQMKNVLKEYESIQSQAIKPEAYASLIYSTNSTSAEYGAFMQKMQQRVVEILTELIFFELEISNLPEENFKRMLSSEHLENYKHFLEKLHEWKKHRLSEQEEKVMELKSLTGAQALMRLFEQELSGQKFTLPLEGEEKQLTQAQMLNLLYTSDDQELRKNVAHVFTQKLLEKESVITFIFNMLAQDKFTDDKLRRFEFPEQARHLANEADPQTVETLCQVVEENYNLVSDYYKFKQKALGLDKLYDYDRYAPFKLRNRKYTFEQAKELVIHAFAQFDESFGKMAEEFFQKKWIDAPTKEGKRSGAYCSGIAPDIHPYVFMNFDGSANDVMTLAHELGHGIHDQWATAQTYVNYHTPLTLAETASTFAETLVFNQLVASEKDSKVLLGLYMQKIEGIFASVFRQVSMYRFEQDFHRTFRSSGELTRDQINTLWRSRQSQMFGDSVVLTPEYDRWWLYISHFVQVPFYVYAYPFGELLALGLIERANNNKNDFAKQYAQFLAGAGSKSPQELVKIFQINLADKNFWQSGMNIIKQYLAKAQELNAQI